MKNHRNRGCAPLQEATASRAIAPSTPSLQNTPP